MSIQDHIAAFAEGWTKGDLEVQSTTLVVIATSIFFGFYLWGLDLVFSRVLSLVLKR